VGGKKECEGDGVQYASTSFDTVSVR